MWTFRFSLPIAFALISLAPSVALAQTAHEKESVEALEVDDAVKVINVSHAENPAQVFKKYKEDRDQALKKLVDIACVPPKDKAQAQAQVGNVILIVIEDLDTVIKMTDAVHSGQYVERARDVKRLAMVEKERWGVMGELAHKAVAFQSWSIGARNVLKDAAEDTPKKADAIVDELKVVEESLEEAGSDVDAQAQQRRKQFISTVVSNVQHAWESIVESAQELKDKKEFQPATVDSQINPIKTQLDAIAQDTNEERPFADTSRELSELLKKTQTEYKTQYQKAMDALEPVITGRAANEVSIFRDVKPGELLSRAMDALADRQ